MKFPVTQIDIRLSILDGMLLLSDFRLPCAAGKFLPHTEVLEIKNVPVDVAAYIEFMEGMAGA